VLSLRRVLVLVALVSCAPPRWVDRAMLVEDARPVDRPPAPDAGPGEDAAADSPEADTPPPLPDAGADLGGADHPDADLPPDAAPDQAPARTVLMVVGNRAAPTTGDMRLQATLEARGLSVVLASDEDTVAVTNQVLVVLAESSASMTLGQKYRDVNAPVLVLERAVFGAMGLTGSNFNDQGNASGTQVEITMPSHAMAAGLTGTVTVMSAAKNMGWGRPAAGAERVATVPGMTDQVLVFGYARGAMTVIGPTPARRVGCFVSDDAANVLNDNGLKLLGAAIDWALQ
jgi:hypothetical protein